MKTRDFRIDLRRRREDGRYTIRVAIPGRSRKWLVSDEAFSRRVDALDHVCAIVGIDPPTIQWFNERAWGAVDTTIYDYGQVRLNDGRLFEVFVWKRWWRR